MYKENNIKSIGSTDSLSNKKPKIKEIYDLIEESSSDEEIQIISKHKQKKENNNKCLKLFEGRNVIKKVKTHCLKVFYRAIKDCTDLRETLISTYRLKIYEKRMIYKTFKSDISKFRNKVLLNLKMRKIMGIFSNININDNSKIKPDKILVYKFLMNSTWYEILNYVKRNNKEIIKQDILNPISDISIAEINEYLEYIKSGSINYKERINLDKNYLSFFEKIIEGYQKYEYDNNNLENEKKIVERFFKKFEGV
jgi:hypothetical protein